MGRPISITVAADPRRETSFGARTGRGATVDETRGTLFVRLRWVALESVNGPRLGQTKREPILRDELQRNQELLATLHGDGVQFILTLELRLEGKLAHELLLIA